MPLCWKEIFNSDAKIYWGAGDLNNSTITTTPKDENGEWHQ